MKVIKLSNRKYYIFLPYIPSGEGRDAVIRMARNYHYPDLKDSRVNIRNADNVEFDKIYYRDL